MASWRSTGAAWTQVFCSGLVPEAAEAQLRAIARYETPGGSSVDDFLHHMLRLGDFMWELRNQRLGQLLREPLSAAARVHRWLTTTEGDCPPPPPSAPWQGLRGLLSHRERHPGMSTARGPPPIPGPAGGFLEAPAGRPLLAVDHRARLPDRVESPHSWRGVGARMGRVVRRHTRAGDPRTAVRHRPA